MTTTARKTSPKPTAKPTKAAAPSKAPTPKPVAKPAPKATGQAATPTVSTPRTAVVSAPDKAAKPKKPKLVRDSFTIPKPEYTVLEELKQRAAKLAQPAKKSELLRAGVKALAAMSNADFLAALKAVPAIKTGRPKS